MRKLVPVVTVLMCSTLVNAQKLKPLLKKDLPDLSSKEAEMITVEFPPGWRDPVHRHNAYTFVYVLQGEVVMQLKGGREEKLGPGQTFYESPNDIHSVTRNASATQAAKFLVFFLKDKGAPELVPIDEASSSSKQ